jgi:hypothetical protein
LGLLGYRGMIATNLSHFLHTTHTCKETDE